MQDILGRRSPGSRLAPGLPPSSAALSSRRPCMFVLSYWPGKKIRFPTLRAALPFLLIALSAASLLGCGGITRNTDTEMAPVAEHGNVPAAMHQAQPKDEAPPAEPNQVVIDNFRFSPRKLTVPAGTKVTWLNRDDVPH